MSTELGHRAEEAAANHVRRLGFTILAQNWRTRWCELDLVAQRGEIIHIIEVKYRSNPNYGSGFDYITAEKRRRLLRAAAVYISQQAPGSDYRIDVASVTGNPEAAEVSLLENAVSA